MNDTIYREDAIEVVSLSCGPCLARNSDDCEKCSVPKLRELINAIPSADRQQEDFVSRQYLLAEIDDLADEFSEVDENGLHSERWCGISDARCVIANAPFMADRQQGEWIIEIDANGNTYGRCSICGMRQYAGQLNYCPDCGSRMKELINE